MKQRSLRKADRAILTDSLKNHAYRSGTSAVSMSSVIEKKFVSGLWGLGKL